MESSLAEGGGVVGLAAELPCRAGVPGVGHDGAGGVRVARAPLESRAQGRAHRAGVRDVVDQVPERRAARVEFGAGAVAVQGVEDVAAEPTAAGVGGVGVLVRDEDVGGPVIRLQVAVGDGRAGVVDDEAVGCGIDGVQGLLDVAAELRVVVAGAVAGAAVAADDVEEDAVDMEAAVRGFEVVVYGSLHGGGVALAVVGVDVAQHLGLLAGGRGAAAQGVGAGPPRGIEWCVAVAGVEHHHGGGRAGDGEVGQHGVVRPDVRGDAYLQAPHAGRPGNGGRGGVRGGPHRPVAACLRRPRRGDGGRRRGEQRGDQDGVQGLHGAAHERSSGGSRRSSTRGTLDGRPWPYG